MSAEARRTGTGSWELPLLLLAAAALALPDVFDLSALKGGALAALAAVLIVPRLLLVDRGVFGALPSLPGALPWLLSLGWAAVGSLDMLGAAAVADRLIVVGLALLAALLGARAARRDEPALRDGVLAATLVTALVAILQALGIERRLTAGEPEVVALMGNSMRAGALLAVGVAASFATLLRPDPRMPAWRVRLAAAALNFGTAALLLTRARGGWLAAACAMAVVAIASRESLVPRLRVWGVPLLVGLALGAVLGDGTQLLRPKVGTQQTLFSASDPTLNVRLAVWGATLDMTQAAPFTGAGLGRYRERFPPWRRAEEAALPGLHGARTEVDHPHNEWLLAAAEGGWPAAALLAAAVLLALRSAWRGARGAALVDHAATRDHDAPTAPPDAGQAAHIALAVLVAGTVAALVQDAFTSPGNALPFFAAAGWAWARARGDGAAADAALPQRTGLALGTLLAALLFIAAWPRLQCQLGLRSFYLAADAGGLTPASFALLREAADADPGDLDAQRLLVEFGSLALQASPEALPDVTAAVETARARIARLAPHAP